MKAIAGAVRQKQLSNNISRLAWREALWLIGLGVGAVVLHATFRWPLRLPGHHGLLWMALLMVGRSLSRYRWASTVSSLGAAGAAFMPFWGFGDPFIGLIYFLPGPVIDGVFNLGRPWQEKAWFLATLAGLAHATKPLARLIISLLTGWPYGSLLFGLAYPLATHIVFGLLGGLAGAGLVWGLRRRGQRRD